ncbi:MAG: dipeptide epimerase, partial [Phycisphaerae bacterium]
MRRSFRHASAERTVASPLLLRIELVDGAVGYGETHLRPYVTGERPEEVTDIIERTLIQRLLEFRPGSFPEALEQIQGLPFVDAQDRPLAGTRAAVELALLDATSRSFRMPLEVAAQWLGAPRLGSPGSTGSVRFSGIVGSESPAGVRWSIRKMRLYGLRDFKLKVGDEGDHARLEAAVGAL